jgi:thymidylate kinase
LEIAVDPKRFRYGGPRLLAKWALKLLPRPDLVILLDAPAEVLQSRKQEVPFAETARQREAYRRLVSELPNGRIIDAAGPVEEVLESARQTILGFLAARTSRRFRIPEDR